MFLSKFRSILPSVALKYFLVHIVFVLAIPFATSLNFSFHSFGPRSQNQLKLVRDARLSSSKQAIELTLNPPRSNSNGRVIYYQPLQLWIKNSDHVSHFTTYFSFIIDSQRSRQYASGMVFFLAGINFPFPVEAKGSSFGLLSRNETISNDVKYPFVAVEFDTYENEWDPGYKHVGIDINNMNSTNTTKWFCSIEHGRKNEAWVSYNFTKKMFSATFTGYKGNSTIRQNILYEVDLRDYLPELVSIGFSAATGHVFEAHTLLSWNFSSVPAVSPYHARVHKRKDAVSPGLVAGVSAAGFVLLIAGFCLLWFIVIKDCFTKDTEEDLILDESIKDILESSTGPKKFSYKELAKATGNFSDKEKLGEGGFGAVYKGYLKKSDCYVAVKKISATSKQGLKEFLSEVLIISSLRHRNLVQLVGWCLEKNNFLLVYEYMSNGSLASYLFTKENFLSWDRRFKIALGLASALLYLHEDWEECVLHRDIKPSNVLLDSGFICKLGDFGLARLVDHGKGSTTTILAGTMGYMAPEYATTGKASKESDVYSFGIVALEIACGRKTIDPMAEEGQVVMLKWVWELYASGRLLEAADKRLCAEFDKRKMECLMIAGLWCAHPDYSQRPSMRQAIQVLQSEVPLPTLSLNMPVASSIYDLLGTTATTSGQSYPPATSSFSQSSNTNVSQLTSSSIPSTLKS